MGLTEGLITNALYDVAKKILRKDPIMSALDQTVEEITREKQDGWYELREIDRNQKEIFNNINIVEEATFRKILIDNGVLPEIASRLYKKFSEKFKGNIQEAAKKEPEVFFHYAIREFDNIKTDNKELIKFLTGFVHKNDFYLDRIIKHFEDLEKIPINIPDIQSVLRKGEISEGVFFRKEPAWMDFEQGFIVERKEVNEIIKNLENNKVQLALGAPASGKSIILKNVGFELAKDNKKVYVVELKKHLLDEIKLFFENIPKIDDENPIFIVDDAHLYLSYCERLAEDFKSRGKGSLIIGSRETREITEEHPKEGADYDLLSELSKTCIHVQAEDVTERMIKTYLEKQYHFDKDKIKTISSNLNKYKKDLWLLSWALIAFDKDKESVDIDEIYKKISDSIEKIKVGKDKEAINAEDVLLPLSIFYRYEIPIERYFLEEQLEIDGNIINKLIGLQEIEETKETKMISLQHSSIAELYLGAYLSKSFLGRRIKKKILNGRDKKDLEFCLFYRYLTKTDSRNAVDIVEYLKRDWKDGLKILRTLIEEDKIQESIENGINIEEDIEKVGRCVSYIAEASEEVALKLVDSFSVRINKEEDIRKVWRCISQITQASKEVALKLANSIDINALSSKINKEENIGQIGHCISRIAWACREVALKLLESIDINSLYLKINKENDIEKVGLCVSQIARVSEEVAMKLVDCVSAKIDTEDDIGKVGAVYFIALVSRKVALKLLESIDINSLSLKINKEDDIEKVGSCLVGISVVGEEVLNEIFNKLDPELRDELQAWMPYIKILATASA